MYLVVTKNILVAIIGENLCFLALLVALNFLTPNTQNYIYSRILFDHWSIIVVHGEVLVMIIGDCW